MFKMIVSSFLIVILLAGGILYFYYSYEKPNNIVGESLTNFNIKSMEGRRQVSTGYRISMINIENNYSEGITYNSSLIRQKVPINYTLIYLYNYNINNQTYYTDLILTNTLNVSNETQNLYTLNLVRPGNITMKYSVSSNSVLLQLESQGIYQNTRMCYKRSNNIIRLMVKGIYVKKPKRFNDYEKCIDLQLSFNQNITEYQMKIDFIKFQEFDIDDYIGLVFYDSDDIGGYEGLQGENIYGDDFNYTINFY